MKHEDSCSYKKGGWMGRFEDKKFVRISRLMERWDCSEDLIRQLISKGTLVEWHPEGRDAAKGKRIDVASVLRVETRGYLNIETGRA